MAFYEDIIETEGNSLACLLCKTPIENNNQVIEFHIEGEKHTKLCLERLLILNNICKTMKCYLCASNITDLKIHIQSSRHKEVVKKINDFVEMDGGFIELPSKILQTWVLRAGKTNAHCTICDEYVLYTLNDILTHINNEKHRRAKSMVLQPFNGILSVEGSTNDLWCTICHKYFGNYIENIFNHVDDPDHYKELGKIVRLIEGQNITIDNYLTNATEDKATCNSCKTQVACNVDNLERHIKGKRHKNSSKQTVS